jgi:hypothetical protein
LTIKTSTAHIAPRLVRRHRRRCPHSPDGRIAPRRTKTPMNATDDSQQGLHRPGRRAVLALVVTAMLATSACDHRISTSPRVPAISGRASAPAPSATTSGRSYPAATNACDLFDDTRLVNALGVDAGVLIAPPSQHTRVLSVARCIRQYGPPASRSLVQLEVTVANHASAESLYSGLRAVHTRQYHLTDHPGLGQSAYSYTDPDTGAHLVTYDANLYLTILIQRTNGSTTQPATTSTLMADEAHHALTTLASS